jgi:hypothetical protein
LTGGSDRNTSLWLVSGRYLKPEPIGYEAELFRGQHKGRKNKESNEGEKKERRRIIDKRKNEGKERAKKEIKLISVFVIMFIDLFFF